MIVKTWGLRAVFCVFLPCLSLAVQSVILSVALLIVSYTHGWYLLYLSQWHAVSNILRAHEVFRDLDARHVVAHLVVWNKKRMHRQPLEENKKNMARAVRRKKRKKRREPLVEKKKSPPLWMKCEIVCVRTAEEMAQEMLRDVFRAKLVRQPHIGWISLLIGYPSSRHSGTSSSIIIPFRLSIERPIWHIPQPSITQSTIVIIISPLRYTNCSSAASKFPSPPPPQKRKKHKL